MTRSTMVSRLRRRLWPESRLVRVLSVVQVIVLIALIWRIVLFAAAGPPGDSVPPNLLTGLSFVLLALNTWLNPPSGDELRTRWGQVRPHRQAWGYALVGAGWMTMALQDGMGVAWVAIPALALMFGGVITLVLAIEPWTPPTGSRAS